MLLFIKTVNLTLNEETGAIIISGIKYNIYDDVNRLIKGFSKIQEDLEIMENQFDKKFDKLIRSYFKHSEQEKVKKEQDEINITIASSAVSEHPFLSEILPKIFFKDFLMFYDEYSYAINERIINLRRSLFKDVVKEAEKVRNFNEIIQSKLKNNEDYKKFEYLDLHYFRNKLETKLSTVFGNTVSEIRHILYELNFEDEASEMEYIHLFYLSFRYYKEDVSTKSGNESFVWLKNIPESLLGYRKIIHDTILKYADYISYDLHFLYNYHQTVSKIFDVSNTRFDIYEKLLDMYGSIKNAPFSIDFKEKESFVEHDSQQYLRTPEYNFLYEELKISALKGHVFTYANYNLKERFYNILFKDIKDFLESIYT